MTRFTRHLWLSGVIGAVAFCLIVVIALSLPIESKLLWVSVAAVIGICVAVVTYWQRRGEIPPLVRYEQTVSRAAEMVPFDRILDPADCVVGVFTRGPYSKHYFMVGHETEAEFWYVAIGRYFPHRIQVVREGMTGDQLSAAMTENEARFVPPGEYNEAVVGKYFAGLSP